MIFEVKRDTRRVALNSFWTPLPKFRFLEDSFAQLKTNRYRLLGF